jgi:hypothetical protein
VALPLRADQDSLMVFLGLGLLLLHVGLVKLHHHRVLVKLRHVGLHLVKGYVARDCRFLWALVGNLQPRGVALPLRADQDSLTAFLMFSVTVFPWVLIVGAYCVHVDLLKPALTGEHVVELVLDDVLVCVECRRVFGIQLLHVDFLRLAPHNEHLGELVLGPSFLLLISLH